MKKTRNTIFTLLFVAAFFGMFTIAVHASSPKSIEAVMSEIRIEQGVSSNEEIDPKTVSKEKLEDLGDSVMEAMIGNSEIHEQMDERMGGEGSDSLRAMHERMGYNYLTGYPYGMMGPGYSRLGGMMGYYGGYGMAVLGLFVILLIAILVVLLRMQSKRSQNKSFESPLDILNKRYAKGEINKEEYEIMKESLNK